MVGVNLQIHILKQSLSFEPNYLVGFNGDPPLSKDIVSVVIFTRTL